jgi:hypothetical protein
MKTIAVDDMTSEKFDSCLKESQEDRVLLTRNGSAVAVLVGVQNQNAPEIEVVDDPEFWAMIAERRKQPCLTSAELKKKMELMP